VEVRKKFLIEQWNKILTGGLYLPHEGNENVDDYVYDHSLGLNILCLDQ